MVGATPQEFGEGRAVSWSLGRHHLRAWAVVFAALPSWGERGVQEEPVTSSQEQGVGRNLLPPQSVP